MKKKKHIILGSVIALVVVALGVVLFLILKHNNKNKLTVSERNWINENISTVQNVNVINNAAVFGKDGSGVYYDFLDDFKKEYDLTINPVTFNDEVSNDGVIFTVSKSFNDKDLLVYKDHYVYVSTDKEIITHEEDLNGKVVGVISNDLTPISAKLKKASNLTFKQFNSKDELLAAFKSEKEEEKIKAMIVPLMDYLDEILKNNYHINYHLSDLNNYYVIKTGSDTLSSVVRKYYQRWKASFDDALNRAMFKTFKDNLNLSDIDIDKMQSVSYNYGFVNASPYEVITGGKYGGIVAIYLSKFSDFANIEFNFNKYKNYKAFVKAVNDNKVDLYFDYYKVNDKFNKTSGINIEYVVASRRSNKETVRSIYALSGKTVYVDENSKLLDYLKGISGIDLKTYNGSKELVKLNKKDVYIVLDKNTFTYYSYKELNNYTEKYSDILKDEYTFKVQKSDTLYTLLDKYMEVLDEQEMILEGINNHYDTMKSGGFITNIAEYILYFVIIAIVVVLIIIKRSKKVYVAKKIKKEDKIKFIDQLTSLKNRNYLTENIEVWNNNTIYPQTLITIDLNKVQEINDLHGYNEGDKQIQALANILVKTQLDNSEIMRTDGNEFVIYLVGYNQRQITNYIHKLTKEFKKLPYDFGAEFGYSMIMDDIKTIEDALNEAVEDMKKQKETKK